jgi:hypothetical protein
MRYERKNKKIDSRLRLCAKRLNDPFSLLLGAAKTWPRSGQNKNVAQEYDFVKLLYSDSDIAN